MLTGKEKCAYKSAERKTLIWGQKQISGEKKGFETGGPRASSSDTIHKTNTADVGDLSGSSIKS